MRTWATLYGAALVILTGVALGVVWLVWCVEYFSRLLGV
jgi:hypothetical protein